MGKTKGSAVLTAVKILRSNKERARELLPAAMHRYLEERIVVASWYGEEVVQELTRACAALAPEGEQDVYEKMGAFGARAHFEGLYSEMLDRSASARARSLWKTQHDSGELSLTSETPTSASYELTGWDHASREYCRLLGGYFTEVHRLSGAANPHFVHPTCRARRSDRCIWVVSWGAT
ncbi:MAG TPA: hypothetical protein VMR50_06630 [Myxococcota bacterium]|nr:hypothetical protein [Myxococcota bacterium]